MIVYIYKSPKKAETYLYLPKKDAFDDLPDALLSQFGPPQLLMPLNLANRDALAGADLEKVKADVSDKGFYLQLPPPVESMLKQHRQQQGLDET